MGDRLYLFRTLLLGLAITLTGFHTTVVADDRSLSVGYFLHWPSPLVAAISSGEFESALGVDIEWKPQESSYDMNRGLSNGDLDIAFSHEVVPLLELLNMGADVFVAAIAVSYPDYDYCVIGDHAPSGGTQRIATIKGSVSHFRTLATLDHFGIDAGSVEWVFVGDGSAVAKTLYRKTADIGCAYGAPTLRMHEWGSTWLSGVQLEQLGMKYFDVITVSRSLADSNPQRVTDFLGTLDSLNRKYSADTRAARLRLAKSAGLNPKNADVFLDIFEFPSASEQAGAEWLGERVPGYFSELGTFLASHGKLDQSISDYSNYIDTGFLQ